MLISLDQLVQTYNITLKGILHVGAHECEELDHYLHYLPIEKILEALPYKVDLCKERYPNILIENAIVSDVVETVRFNISNNHQSSSFLEFGLHSEFYPYIHYVDSFESQTILLRDLLPKYNIEYNFLNLHIQGVELKALKGMEEYLDRVDYIYTEVNCDYVYKDCALITEVDEYLSKFGLYRVETEWYSDHSWGDAFYIRYSLWKK
jgi:FkbM family methyltransferase